MSDNPLDGLLAELRSYLEHGDHLGAQELLEDAVDAEVERRLAALVDIAGMAQAWRVSGRRARAHVAAVVAREPHAVLRIAGTWFMRPDDVERYKPGPPGKPRKSS